MSSDDDPLGSAPITGLSHVQLIVSDVAASEAWYTAALGLERQAADPAGEYVALRHRGARATVVLSAARIGIEPDGPPSRSARGLDHLAFAVPDGRALRAWADHLDRAGVVHDGIVLENGNPSLQMRDPDGNAIELVAPGDR